MVFYVVVIVLGVAMVAFSSHHLPAAVRRLDAQRRARGDGPIDPRRMRHLRASIVAGTVCGALVVAVAIVDLATR